jgi:hypothetical protein
MLYRKEDLIASQRQANVNSWNMTQSSLLPTFLDDCLVAATAQSSWQLWRHPRLLSKIPAILQILYQPSRTSATTKISTAPNSNTHLTLILINNLEANSDPKANSEHTPTLNGSLTPTSTLKAILILFTT